MKEQKIFELREKVDEIDRKIIEYLEKRLKITEKIISLKEKKNLPLTDKNREKQILENLRILTENHLLKEYIIDIYQIIFNLSKSNFILKKKIIKEFRKIGIIGLGVIGGSIAKAIKYIDPKVKIYTLERKDKDIYLAKKEKIVEKTFPLNNLIDESDLIIISTPIETIIPIAKEISSLKCKDKKIIIDVGSIKEKIVKSFESFNNEKLDFIGTHPMAGSEKSGFENSKVDLFLNNPWIITPHKLNKKENIEKINNLIRNLGSQPVIVDAKMHDIIVARVSHLVFLISKLLFIYTYEKNKNWLKFAGTGFKTTTRLASANPLMHSQIFKNNYKNIKRELNSFIKFIKNFKISPENSFEIFEKYKKARDSLYKENI